MEDAVISKFAERLRTLREAKGLTQTELGEMIGVSKLTIGRWERDEQQIEERKSFGIIDRLAEVFEVSISYMAGMSDDDTPVKGTQLSDEETAEIARAFERETNEHLIHVLSELSLEMQHMVKKVLAEAYEIDKARGLLTSQQKDED